MARVQICMTMYYARPFHSRNSCPSLCHPRKHIHVTHSLSLVHTIITFQHAVTCRIRLVLLFPTRRLLPSSILRVNFPNSSWKRPGSIHGIPEPYRGEWFVPPSWLESLKFSKVFSVVVFFVSETTFPILSSYVLLLSKATVLK